jgi:hypothetical protein
MSNGREVALGTAAGSVLVLDQRTGLTSAAWRAHEAAVNKLDSMGDLRLVSSSIDKSLCLWDVGGSVSMLRSCKGLPEAPLDFCFHHDSALVSYGTRSLGVVSMTPGTNDG